MLRQSRNISQVLQGGKILCGLFPFLSFLQVWVKSLRITRDEVEKSFLFASKDVWALPQHDKVEAFSKCV